MVQTGDLIGGKYRIGEFLGEGGMATVWSAQNEAIGREVAVKVLLGAHTRDKEAVSRFLNEARVASRIRSPRIVDVLDTGSCRDGTPFIVMERLRGRPLDSYIYACGRISAREALPIVRAIAEALVVAHELGVVHRDLKPGNVFLTIAPGGAVEPKVLDFGISKIVEAGSRQHTQIGTVLGSPDYMSPEQAAGQPLDWKTDIYSLGAVLYEAVTGRAPYSDMPNMNALLAAIITRPPRPAWELAPDLPLPVRAILERCMQRIPTARYANARELIRDIDQALYAIGGAARLLRPDLLLAPSAAVQKPPRENGSTMEPTVTGARTIASLAKDNKLALLCLGLAFSLATLGGVALWAFGTDPGTPASRPARIVALEAPPAARPSVTTSIASASSSPAASSNAERTSDPMAPTAQPSAIAAQQSRGTGTPRVVPNAPRRTATSNPLDTFK